MMHGPLRRSLLGLASIVLLAPAGSGQEHIRDGGFDSPLFLNWRTGGPATNPHRAVFDTRGIGNPSFAFTCIPGGGFQLEQDISVVPGAPLVFSMEAADDYGTGTSPGNAIDLIVIEGGSQVLLERTEPGTPGGVARRRMSEVFTPRSASLTVRITVYARSIGSNRASVYIDNVSCIPYELPFLTFHGDRWLGQPVNMTLESVPGMYVVYVAPGLASTPLTLPGFDGSWDLDLTSMFWFVAGGLGSSTRIGLTFSVPNTPALSAIPFWFQGLAVGTSTSTPTFHFGNHSMWPFF